MLIYIIRRFFISYFCFFLCNTITEYFNKKIAYFKKILKIFLFFRIVLQVLYIRKKVFRFCDNVDCIKLNI